MHPWDRDEERLDSALSRYFRRLNRRDPRGFAGMRSGDETPPARNIPGSLPSDESTPKASSPVPPPPARPLLVSRMAGPSQPEDDRSRVADVPHRMSGQSQLEDDRSQVAGVPHLSVWPDLVEQAIEQAQRTENRLLILRNLQATNERQEKFMEKCWKHGRKSKSMQPNWLDCSY